MQVVLEILGTLATTMSIVDTKDLQFGPLVGRDPWRLRLGLNHVEDNRDPIFVRLSHCTDVCIGRKGFDRAESFGANLASLEEWKRGLRLILLQ